MPEQKTTKKETVWQMIKFTLFSISAGLIQIGSFTLLTEVIAPNWSYWPRYLISLVLSVLWNFTFNRRYTFKSATNVPIAMLKMALFYCVFTPLSTWLGNIFANMGVNDYIIEIGTMIVNFVTEFLFCRFVVYRNSINTNDLAKKDAEKAAQTASGTENSTDETKEEI